MPASYGELGGRECLPIKLAGKIERGLDAQQAILPLTAPEREAILVALDDVPDGLGELRDRLRDLERRGAEGR